MGETDAGRKTIMSSSLSDHVTQPGWRRAQKTEACWTLAKAAPHALPLCVVQLSLPQKVLIPERYVESEPEEPLSPQEVEDRHRKVERIKSLLAKSR